MVIYLILVIILLLSSIRVIPHNSNSAFSRDTTFAVNGFFILIVFLRHIYPYINSLDNGGGGLRTPVTLVLSL